MEKITAAIITYNESANLRKTLGQLWWCDEIVVVDSYSTDDTVAICRQYGCRVVQRRFDGYGTQKQFAISLASNDWILSLDADEVLSNELISEIMTEMRDPSADGYLLPLTFVFMGRPMRYGKESRRPFLRLFNKTSGGFDSRLLHEKAHCSGRVKKLHHPVYHYSYRDISHYFDKFNSYTSKGAGLSFDRGKKRSRLLIAMAVPLYFFKYYLLELNFLNGMPGFYWSSFSAFYHFVKYVKTEELYCGRANQLLELGIPGGFRVAESETREISEILQVRLQHAAQ